MSASKSLFLLAISIKEAQVVSRVVCTRKRMIRDQLYFLIILSVVILPRLEKSHESIYYCTSSLLVSIVPDTRKFI